VLTTLIQVPNDYLYISMEFGKSTYRILNPKPSLMTDKLRLQDGHLIVLESPAFLVQNLESGCSLAVTVSWSILPSCLVNTPPKL